jgi:hypothetical protein
MLNANEFLSALPLDLARGVEARTRTIPGLLRTEFLALAADEATAQGLSAENELHDLYLSSSADAALFDYDPPVVWY